MKTTVNLLRKAGAAQLLTMLTLLLAPLFASAQAWESGTSKTGSVSKNVNDVWFSITLPEDGEVSLTAEPLTNVNLKNITLYAIVDGENVQRDFAWVDGSNRTLTCPNLKPGTYKVKMYATPKNDKTSGTFRLHYTFTAPFYKTDPTPNITWDDCPLLEDGVTLHGHMGYAYAPSDIDDVDWFKIEVPKDGKLTFELWSAPTLKVGFAELCVLNAEGTDVQRRNGQWLDHPDSTLVFEIPDVAAGIYYFKMPRYSGYGIYHLTPRFTPVVVDSDPELNDTWQTATLLSDCQPQNAHLGYFRNQNIYKDEVDWFKIVVPEDGKLTFETRSAKTLKLGYAELCALKAGDEDVTRRNGQWLDHPDSTLVFEIPDVSEGTYYFKMPRYSGYGNYYLTYYFTGHKDIADPEPNNTWDTATVLGSGPAVTGQLGYDYKDTKDVQDWYKLSVPEEGAINLTIWSENTLKIGFAEIKAVNAEGTDVDRRIGQWLDHPGDTLTMTLSNAAAGDYYLLLPHYSGYGTYYLRYNFTPCNKQNDAEPNNDYATAGDFARGTVMEARLGYDYNSSKDVADWFKLDVPEEGAITLTIQSENTLKIGYAEIKALNTDGTDTNRRLGQWLDHPGDTLTMILPNAAEGAYYLCMPQYSGYGGYTMRYDFTACAIANDVAGNDSWENATPMEAGTTTEARLGYDYNSSQDAVDWFRLDVPEEGAVTLTIRSEKTLTLGCAEIHTLKADGTGTSSRISKWLDYPDSTLVFALNNCAAGAYYIKMPLHGGYGGYTVKCDFTPCAYANDVAGNDSWADATPIENGTTTQARLGYDYNSSNDAADWFVFTMEADGSATFTIQSEKTLTLGCASINALKADGSGVNSRTSKWLDYPDSLLVFKLENMAAGTYYLYMPHRSGYGGYTVKSEFTKNPYYRETLTNTDFASRIYLEQGNSVYGTLGYQYNADTQTQAWFDLGTMHGTQIDVSVEVEQSHSLSIGVANLYIYKGDNTDGTPILQSVKSARLERSSGTISYLDKNTEDSHYIFYLPRYGGYGGYKVTFEGPQAEDMVELAGTSVKVMTDGRNTVRKGVPCENPITITNTSNEKTTKFMVAVAATDDIDIIGFRMNSSNGSKYVPIDSVTVVEGNDCKHTALFYVPSLDPWESYTFTMISEGKGDIAYSRKYTELTNGTNKIVVNSDTHVIVTVMGYVDGADREVYVDDFIIHRVGDVYDLTGEQRLKLSQLLESLDGEKQQTGIAAYGVYALLKRASDMCGIDLRDATCNIAAVMRLRIEYWMSQIGEPLPDTIDNMDVIDAKAAINDVVQSWDPNEMVGPAGVGEENYIARTQTVSYRILFENKAEAGDAAYRVRISDELDENIFDVSTVRFGETSHDGVGYNWEMKREGNKLSWDIKGIELPPNVNAPEGEGFVSFSVDLKPDLADGTQIKNKAEIIFDKNYPIETNEYVNTLDLAAPVTTMAEAYCNVPRQTVYIDFQSVDAASGVAAYLFFAKHGDNDYTYVGQYTTTPIAYPVQLDPAVSPAAQLNDYSFYVLATDNVGNTELIVPSTQSFVTSISDAPRLNDNGQMINDLRGGVYDLQGRQVETSKLPKGLYISNGRKVVIK